MYIMNEYMNNLIVCRGEMRGGGCWRKRNTRKFMNALKEDKGNEYDRLRRVRWTMAGGREKIWCWV